MVAYNATFFVAIGETIDAYMFNGVMYANIEGVKTNTPLSGVYFASLALTFIGVCVTYVLFWSVRMKKREL